MLSDAAAPGVPSCPADPGSLTFNQLQASFREWRLAQPDQSHEWVLGVQQALLPSDNRAMRGMGKSAGLRQPAHKAVILVNGLWEMGKRSEEGSVRLSHLQLLASLIRELEDHGVDTVLLDLRHPLRIAVFGSPLRVVAERPWTEEHLDREASRGYRTAIAQLLGRQPSRLSVHVAEPNSAETSVGDFLDSVRTLLDSLDLGEPDLLFVAGGILSPWLVEPVLGSVAGVRFLYAMSHVNATLLPSVYERVLTPVPEMVTMPELPTYERPGVISDLHISGGPRLARRLIQDYWPSKRRKPCVVALGLEIGTHMNAEYLELLKGVFDRTGTLELVVLGSLAGLEPELRRRLHHYGIGINEVGVVADIAMALEHLRGTPAVVVNPRQPGNGGSLIQAADAGLPLALFEGNDAEYALSPDVFASTSLELENRIVLLLTSRRARRHALHLHQEYERRCARRSVQVVDELVSWRTKPD